VRSGPGDAMTILLFHTISAGEGDSGGHLLRDYCSTYYKAVRVGEGDGGGHVLRETTRRSRERVLFIGTQFIVFVVVYYCST
jgi:hypothetical protein